MHSRLNTIIFGFLCCLVVSTASAAGTAINLEKWLPDQCHYSGTFTQSRTLQSLPVPIQSNGQFLANCEAGVIWQTETPIFESVIYTARQLDFRITDQTRLIQGLVNQSMSTMLRALMGGDSTYLLNHFSTDKPADPMADTLVLLPGRSPVSRYLQQIELSRADNAIRIKLVHNELEVTEITISDIIGVSQSSTGHCQSLFGNQSDACEALYSPVKLAESLQSDR